MKHEERKYLARAHLTKKHIPRTRNLLLALWRRARRKYQDVWGDLTNLSDNGPHGVILGQAIKSAFRRYMIECQQGRCCYCRRWLVNTAYAKPIEHILPRTHYPQFSLHFWNLAVACTDCNSAKTDSFWGTVSTRRRTYPLAAAFTDAFHPRFHAYDEHVRYVRVETNGSAVALYKGITPQGRQLCRDLLYKVAAKETMGESNPALAPALFTLKTFGAKAEGLALSRFEEFTQALDRSMMRLLDEEELV